MAGSSTRDVSLVIKAKDQSSKELDRISASLKALTGNQNDLTKGADKTGNALGGLAADVAKLQAATDRLKSLSNISTQLDKTSASVQRMQSSIRDSATEFAQLARDSDAAAQASGRLQAQLASEQDALAANKAALRDTSKELTQVNRLVKQAEAAQNSYNKSLAQPARTTAGVGIEAGSSQTSARTSAGTFIAANLSDAKTAQAAVNAEVNNYKTAVDRATKAIADLKPQVDATSKLQRTLAADTDKAAAALSNQKDDLAKARTELASISDISAKASEALGLVSTSQDTVSTAAARMAANLAAAKAKIDALSDVKTPTAATATTLGVGIDPTALDAQRRSMLEAKKVWIDSQAAVKQLAQQMKDTAEPTDALGQAFGRAQAQAKIAKNSYDAQRDSIAKLGSAQSSFAAFASATSAVRSSATETAAAIGRSGSAMADAAGKASVFGASLRALQGDAEKTSNVAGRLRDQVVGLAAGYAGFQAAIGQIGGAITAEQTLEAVQSRLGAVFGQDTGKVATEVAFLKGQADRLGISFSVLADEYGKFAVASTGANFSLEDTRKIFLAVAEAARVNRLSAEDTQGTFLALTQMISKGTVQAEELRGQLGEHLPAAFKLFADAVGVSQGQLSKMLQAGEVLADRSTLLKFADELSKRFGPQLAASLDSASADIGKFGNDINSMQLAIASGLVPGLRTALQSFDAFAKSANGLATFEQIGQGIGKFLEILAEVPKFFDQITFAVEAFAAIKLGGLFTDLATKLVTVSATAAAFSREIALIGPRTQAAAAAQGVLRIGVGQVVSSLGVYRAGLLASTAGTVGARVGAVALAGAVGVLRAGLIGAGAAAEALLTALGGPIGLAITAVTVGLTLWLTSIGDASTAIDSHRELVDRVVDAYDRAKGKAADWAKEIRDGSSIQIKVQLGDAQAELDKLRKGLVAPVDAFGVDTQGTVASLSKVIAAFKSGQLSAADFKTQINSIAEADPHLDRTLVKGFLDTADAAADSEKKVADLKDVLTAVTGNGDEAAAAIKRLRGGVDDLGDASDKALGKADLVKTYTDAIAKLKGEIPGLAEQMKVLKQTTDDNATAWRGMIAAFKAGDFRALAQIITLWSQAGAAHQAEADNKLLNALPDDTKGITERIIKIEGGQDGSGPGTSSAAGVGQFTDSTWLELFNKVFPELTELNDTAKLAYRTNLDVGTKMVAALVKQNELALVKAGINPTPTNDYLAHFLGAQTAIKVILSNPEALAKDIVGASSVKANPSVFTPGLTTGDLQKWAASLMGGGGPLQASGTTKQEDFNTGIDQQIKGLHEEATAQADSNREGAIAKILAEDEAKAVQAGTILTEDRIAALKREAGAKYDSAHADEVLKANQKQAQDDLTKINGLDDQRKTLLQEINEAQDQGDNSKVADLKAQLAGVNDQLTAAIPKAMALAQQLGDEKMVAELMKVEQHTAQAAKQFSFFGLSLNQTRTLVGNLADGIVGIFDSFGQSIASGVDAITAMRNAFLGFAADFLRQIATMILKQAVLNALQSFLPGLGSFGAAHTGGTVGSAATGGGNVTRTISPLWFNNAVRYHTGGVAGLRPDEVPAILKRNEEVLTTDDPRNRLNGGKSPSPSSGRPSIKQVLVFDQKDIANAMASKAGEQVVLTLIKNNRQTLRTLLG